MLRTTVVDTLLSFQTSGNVVLTALSVAAFICVLVLTLQLDA